jgi:hypothetical protein
VYSLWSKKMEIMNFFRNKTKPWHQSFHEKRICALAHTTRTLYLHVMDTWDICDHAGHTCSREAYVITWGIYDHVRHMWSRGAHVITRGIYDHVGHIWSRGAYMQKNRRKFPSCLSDLHMSVWSTYACLTYICLSDLHMPRIFSWRVSERPLHWTPRV